MDFMQALYYNNNLNLKARVGTTSASSSSLYLSQDDLGNHQRREISPKNIHNSAIMK